MTKQERRRPLYDRKRLEVLVMEHRLRVHRAQKQKTKPHTKGG